MHIDALINACIAWAVDIAIPSLASNASGDIYFLSPAPSFIQMQRVLFHATATAALG